MTRPSHSPRFARGRHALLALTVAVLLLTACGSTGSSGATTTVAGHVLAAPACPVQIAGSPCPPRPVAGADVVAEDDGEVVARTTTGSDGSFTLSLPPGSYTVVASTVSGIRSQASRRIEVPLPSGQPPLVLTVDSGIR
jgi:hypothetical protein